MFEMTASLLMENEGKKQTFLKMPEFLRNSFGNGTSYLGIDTGKKILQWINEGEKEDPEVTRVKSEMLMACEFGIAGVIAIWNNLSAPMKKKLEGHKNICKASAQEYENQQKLAELTPGEELRDRIESNGATKIEML